MLAAWTSALLAPTLLWSAGTFEAHSQSVSRDKMLVTTQAEDPAVTRQRLRDIRKIAPPDKSSTTAPLRQLPAPPEETLRLRKDQALRTFQDQQKLDIERDLRDSLRK